MKECMAVLLAALLIPAVLPAQYSKEDIRSDFVLYKKRNQFQQNLQENVINKSFSLPLDSDNEYLYESACNAISQFQLTGSEISHGFDKLFLQYDSLAYDTRRALLEAVYATYPHTYVTQVQAVLDKETHPKLFAMSAAYLVRNDNSTNSINNIKIRMVENFSNYDSLDLLLALEQYLNHYTPGKHPKTPDIADLFQYQAARKVKAIYSFQRWNRNYPGLAIVQDASGRFMKHPDGRLMVFEQLARSASDLPYFITNGSTPQGVFCITGTAVSGNTLIGPTPNLQLIMPNEETWEKYFQLPTGTVWDSTQDSLKQYLQLFPPSWRNYSPVKEIWQAGKIGRSEIIAHGTTIDPEYFKGMPWYPLTPTNGCLCAKELWNITTGHLLVSEQLNLVSTFMSTPGSKGYLYVINLDDQPAPVTRAELDKWVKAFERSR